MQKFKLLPILLLLLVAALLTAGCGGSKPADTGGQKASAPATSAGDDLVAKAKAEGKVVLYAGGHTREGVESVAKAFQEKYGIPVEYTRKGSGEVVKMVEAEKSANAIRVDMISVADPTIAMGWAKSGLLANYKPSNWDDIIDSVKDKDGYWSTYSITMLGIMYNTAKLKNPPQTWEEIFDPKYKVVHASPAYSGTAASFMNAIINSPEGWAFYEKLKKNSPIVVQSALALPQMLLAGEADLGIPGIESQVEDAKKAGQPVGLIYPKKNQPTLLSPIAVMKDAPHPNAARLLYQFHLSPEGQKLHADGGGRSVLKKDPPVAPGLTPMSQLSPIYTNYQDLEANKKDQFAKFDAIMGAAGK